MEKKKLIICILALVVCAGIITIGVLTEKKGGVEPIPSPSVEKIVESDADTENTLVNTETTESHILTIENCKDLVNLLTDESSETAKTFVEKYKGQTIEFDGNIANIINHDDYDTRYDILIYAGDYNKESAQGPNFKFEDVNTYDLGIKDLYLPDFVNTGSNIHIVAEVESYNDVAGVLHLNPISIQPR